MDCALGVWPQPYYLPETYMGSAPKCSGSKHKIRQPGNANRPIGKGRVWSVMLCVCCGTYFRYRSEFQSSSWPACVPMRRLAFPGEELPFLVIPPLPPVISTLPVIPAFPPSFLPFPRHSCLSPVIPAKAGILIRAWAPLISYRPDPHQRLKDTQLATFPV